MTSDQKQAAKYNIEFPELSYSQWAEVIIVGGLALIVGIASLTLSQESCPGSSELIVFLIVCGSLRLVKFVANCFHLVYFKSWSMNSRIEGLAEAFFMLFSVTYGIIALKQQWEFNILIKNNAPNFNQENNGCDQGIYELSWAIVVWSILLLTKSIWHLECYCKRRFCSKSPTVEKKPAHVQANVEPLATNPSIAAIV